MIQIFLQDNQSTGSEGDRRRDAWIPTDEAKKILIQVIKIKIVESVLIISIVIFWQAQTSSAGSFFPERDVLTMPGVVLESDLVYSNLLHWKSCVYVNNFYF